jgi:hypothetical protein
MENRKQSAYTILSKIVKLKFYHELEGSGIELEDIYKVTNLQTGKDFYLLEINKRQIRFVTRYDFVVHFCNFLKNNIEYYESQYKKLISRKPDEFSDEIAIEFEYKTIDYCKTKQERLLKMMKAALDDMKKER